MLSTNDGFPEFKVGDVLVDAGSVARRRYEILNIEFRRGRYEYRLRDESFGNEFSYRADYKDWELADKPTQVVAVGNKIRLAPWDNKGDHLTVTAVGETHFLATRSYAWGEMPYYKDDVWELWTEPVQSKTVVCTRTCELRLALKGERYYLNDPEWSGGTVLTAACDHKENPHWVIVSEETA
jgi:hypothetical protein